MKTTFKEITKRDCRIVFEELSEDLSPEDLLDSQEDIDAIYKAYENCYSVQPEWFCAHVSVEYTDGENEYQANDYLGGCSYSSFDEFLKDAYYSDMVDHCIAEINKQRLSEFNHYKRGLLKRAQRFPDLHKRILTTIRNSNQ